MLRLTDISASYDGRTVLENVCLEVADHDFLGIVGPNGGGKTTLIKVMLGLKKPDSGSVRFTVGGMPAADVSIGYLPQYSHLDRQFPVSVREVVRSGLASCEPLFGRYPPETRALVDGALDRMGLTALADRHIGALSGGQLQRVLLARAIVARPSMVVLDEPNTYMDRHFQASMYKLLHDINGECAVVVVSHDVDSLRRNARNIAYVDHTLTYNPASMPL